MILIIAEKPDLMRKLGNALLKGNISKKQKTVAGRTINVALEDSNIIITCSHGHLYRYKYPNEIDEEKYKTWSMDHLPLMFDDIPLIASSDAFNKALISSTKELLERSDVTEVVCACDADREGESIPRETINMIAASSTKVRKLNSTRTFTRMWYVEQGESQLREAFKNRKPLSYYDNIYFSAKARQFADYKVGLTATEAMTLKVGQKGNVMTVGRVQTPTLRIIVDLEKEIRNFVPQDFFKVNAITDTGIIGEYKIPNSKDNRFEKRDDAKSVVDKTGIGPAKVIKAETKESKQNPKKLYSMSSLQADMNRKYNLTAHQTLEIAQKLYENAFTTYPRTEEECVSEEFAERIQECMKNNEVIFPYHSDVLNEILENNYKLSSNVISKLSQEIGAHEAITPSTSSVSADKISHLSDIERKVYFAIVERFLQNFFPPAVYDVQNIEFERNNSVFFAQFKALKKKGYLTVSSDVEESNDNLVKLNVGDTVKIKELKILESKTQPPARFTEASLIEMMKNPVKYLDSKDEKDIIKETSGIGTGATRDAIIEGLKKQNLIEIQKKSVVPTDKGMFLIDAIPSELIKSVSLTAYFETKLKDIYNGNYTFEQFQKEIDNLMKKFIDEVKNMNVNKTEISNKNSNVNVLCKCPNCGKNIVISKFGYYCEDKECGTKIFVNHLEKSLGLKNINKTQAKELFTKGKTSKKVKLKNKSGKEYEAKLTYTYEKDKQYPNNVWITFD